MPVDLEASTAGKTVTMISKEKGCELHVAAPNKIHKPEVKTDKKDCLHLGQSSRWRLYMAIISEFVLSIVMSFLSIGTFVMSNGYYTYSDQTWPLEPYLPSSGNYVGSMIYSSGRLAPNYIFQFTRGIISWPWVVISALSPSYEVSVRAFLFYTFMLFFAAAWITAEIVTRALEEYRQTRVSALKREVYKLSIVIMLAANLVSIQYNVDGGTFSDGLILLCVVCEAIIVAQWSRRNSSIIALGVLLSLTLLLDPDYFLISLIVVAFVAMVTGIIQGHVLQKAKVVLTSTALSLPVLAFTLAGLYLTSSPAGLGSYRSVDQASGWISSNMSFQSAFLLYGYGWSTITYAPPTILFNSGNLSSLPVIGSPANILLPPDILSAFWFLALLALPITAISSLFISQGRRLSIPFVLLAILGILLAQYPHIPWLYGTFVDIGGLPFVGLAISTSLAVPDHLLIIVASAYVLAASLTLFLLIESSAGSPPTTSSFRFIRFSVTWRAKPVRVMHARRCDLVLGGNTNHSPTLLEVKFRADSFTRHRLRTILAISMVALVVLSGWQAFNGSYFPARANSDTFQGNGVPDQGAYSPFDVTSDTLKAYDKIFSNGTDFNVYWPVGDGIGLQGQMGRSPSVNLPGLPFLISSGFRHDVANYLVTHGVRYLVVQNLSLISVPTYYPSRTAAQDPYLFYFGLPTFEAVTQFLGNTSGLFVFYHSRATDVYEVSGTPGLTYDASILLNSPTEAGVLSTSYQLFHDIGTSVAISSSSGLGLPVGVGFSPNDVVSIITPTNLTTEWLKNQANTSTGHLNVSSFNSKPGIVYFSNSSLHQGADSWIQNNSLGQYNHEVDGFDFTDWQGEANISFTNGGISMYSRMGADITLNYGGPATTFAPYGVPVQSAGTVQETHLSAAVSVTQPAQSKVVASFSAVNLSGGAGTAFLSYTASVSGAMAQFKVSNIVPNGSQYFTYRLGGEFVGYMNISYYNISLENSLGTVMSDLVPFGTYAQLGNTTVSWPESFQSLAIIIRGNGTVNGVPINSHDFESVNLASVTRLLLNGKLQVGGAVGFSDMNYSTTNNHIVVYNGAFASCLKLVFNGSQVINPGATVYDTNMYVLPGAGNYSFSIISMSYLNAFYIVIVAYMVSLCLVGLTIQRCDPAGGCPRLFSRISNHRRIRKGGYRRDNPMNPEKTGTPNIPDEANNSHGPGGPVLDR
jgi:hypothetical protein